MEAVRSLLFVPGYRPDRFERARSSSADLVCLDLEDATPPGSKAEARAACVEFLNAHPEARLGVRINSLASEWGEADLEAVGAVAGFLLVPKAEALEQLAQARSKAPDTPLWPLVETAEGLRNAWDIAAAPGVAGILFGAFDYSVDIGCELDWEPLFFARSQLAAACARARVQLMDAPSANLSDDVGLAASTARVKALGFTARACIHPAQLDPVNAAFLPTQAEIARANDIVRAFDAAAGGATQLDGQLVDLPVLLAAQRVLAKAKLS